MARRKRPDKKTRLRLAAAKVSKPPHDVQQSESNISHEGDSSRQLNHADTNDAAQHDHDSTNDELIIAETEKISGSRDLQSQIDEMNERSDQERYRTNELIAALQKKTNHLEETVQQQAQKISTLEEKLDEANAKLRLTFPATKRLRALQFLECYPNSPSSLTGKVKQAYVQLCAWKHGPIWNEALLLVSECDEDDNEIPRFIPTELLHVLFEAQFGVSVEQLRGKWKVLVQCPAIAELFQLHAALVRANVLDFPAFAKRDGYRMAEAKKGVANGSLYKTLHQKLVDTVKNLNAGALRAFDRRLISRSSLHEKDRGLYDVLRVAFWALINQVAYASREEEMRLARLLLDLCPRGGDQSSRSIMSLTHFESGTLGRARLYRVHENSWQREAQRLGKNWADDR